MRRQEQVYVCGGVCVATSGRVWRQGGTWPGLCGGCSFTLLWGGAITVLTCHLFSTCQTVTSARLPTDPMQPCARPPPTSSTSSVAPGSISGPGPSAARASPVNRPSSAASKSLSPVASRSPGAAVSAPSKPQSPAQNAAAPQESSQDKLAEQMALVRGWHLPACDTQLLSSRDAAAGSCLPSSEHRQRALWLGGHS